MNPPQANAQTQQACFDDFLRIYNQERPHEALGQTPPATFWRPSPRPYPDRIDDPVYTPDHVVRRVRSSGEIRWRGDLVFISEALIGEIVGVRETAAGNWVVRFFSLDIGLIERSKMKLRRFTAPRPGRREASRQT